MEINNLRKFLRYIILILFTYLGFISGRTYQFWVFKNQALEIAETKLKEIMQSIPDICKFPSQFNFLNK